LRQRELDYARARGKLVRWWQPTERDLAALEQERETLKEDWTARDRQRPPPGAAGPDDRACGLADWERAHGRAELELRAVEGGWWDEWLAGRGPGGIPARPTPRRWAEPAGGAGGGAGPRLVVTGAAPVSGSALA
jgi:hypothetical protein